MPCEWAAHANSVTVRDDKAEVQDAGRIYLHHNLPANYGSPR